MVLSPSAAHESILAAVMEGLGGILKTIPIPKSKLYCQIYANSSYRSKSICLIPDMTIKMLINKSQEGPHHKPRNIWLIESAFSQSNHNIMDKIGSW